MGITLPQPLTFEWDDGNNNKSYLKHEVSVREAEEVFLSAETILLRDKSHSTPERRYLIMGPTFKRRLLSVAFTIRKKRIRVISARPAGKKERNFYEKAIKIA